ncbi:MAG: PKD domain-containing protein, partial [Methanomicrobiaceae archaeon]|nr:PKD domain-containing protein [Methanomicrobiaceae archaeon]
TVTDEDDDTDSYELTITVDDDSAPTADFDLYSDDYEDSGAAPFAVRFIDESEPSEETNSTITEWYWEYIDEDGDIVHTSTSQNPYSYTFENAGLYTIRLTVTDEDGATDTETKEDFIEVTLGLSATFSASVTSGYAPLTVSFTATDGSDNDYDIEIYYWTFGDGAVTTTATGSTSHTYTTAGTYDVKLKVTDEEENTYTYTRENYITVNTKSTAAAATTQATTAPLTAANTVETSSGTKIFGLPGTEFFRDEIERFYDFYEEYLSILTGMFGMS